jgi:hypothetical protein
MGSRGRKSAASLTVAATNTNATSQRPAPPDELTNEQAEEWRAVVGRLLADWFPRETWAMLAQYCRHVITARRVAQIIRVKEGADPFDIEEYDRLLKLQEREGRAMSALASRLRFTQQKQFNWRRRKPKSGARPWQ